MPGTVKSELLPDADRSHKCDCQEKVSWKRNLPLDKSHFITETGIIAGELYRKNGEWKFNAVGSGYQGGLSTIARNFGLNI